jgi:hypothetical protein
MRRSRLTRLTLVAVIAALGALAAPAGALPIDGGGGDPPIPPDRADLRVSALTVSPVGSDWSISYTVVNSGSASAGTSTIAFNGGPGLTASRSVASLSVGASRSATFSIPRTADCFTVLNAAADSTKVVSEANETNNTRQAVGVVPPCPARYRVSVSSFTAIDESGIDWTGSDEPYWIFSTVGTGGTASTRASQVFGSIDSGDTQSFGVADGCLWGCGGSGAPAPFGIGLSVQLWEQDLGHVDQTLYDTASFFQSAGPILTATGAPAWVGTATTAMGKAMDYILGWADDDLLGTNTYAFDAAGLAAALPNRGMSFTDTRHYNSSDADYTLTMVVSRIV